MATCYVCGTVTQLYENGVPVCPECCEEQGAAPEPPRPAGGFENINTRLNTARHEYLKALLTQREAAELGRSFSANNPDGNRTLHNANRQLSLASAKYEQVLQEFINGTSMRRRSG